MSAFETFEGILAQYGKLLFWAVGGSASLPLIAKFSGLSPVWPPATTLLTSLLTLVTIIMAFQFLLKRGKRHVNKIMLISLVVMVSALISYLYMFDRFTFVIPTNSELIYLGCGWSELASSQAAKYLFDPESGCPGEYERVLEAIQYEAKIVWTKTSVANVKLAVAVLWFTFFSAFSFLVGSFLVYQHGK